MFSRLRTCSSDKEMDAIARIHLFYWVAPYFLTPSWIFPDELFILSQLEEIRTLPVPLPRYSTIRGTNHFPACIIQPAELIAALRGNIIYSLTIVFILPNGLWWIPNRSPSHTL